MIFEPYHISKPVIIVLAGGASNRLGRAKQALPYEGSTFLQHTVAVAEQTALGPVCVVLGARAETTGSLVFGEDILVIRNENWASGMASTLQKGLRFMLKKYPEMDGAFFLVCDQPFIEKDILVKLLKQQQASGKAMVAAAYDDKMGTPAIFSKQVFDKLLELEGDTGARKLIKQYPNDVASIAFEAGRFDIDTEADYKTLMMQKQPVS